MNDTKLHEALGIGGADYTPLKKHRWIDNFGLEFEVENCTAAPRSTSLWTTHQDGSLVNGMEFVLSAPMRGDMLYRALDEFYDGNLRASNGLRTSTHVHIEGRDLTVDQLRSMIVLMYTLEDDLFRYVGENRKWAGYSMGLAEMNTQRLSSILSDNNRSKLRSSINSNRGAERYYGFNVASLLRHGSLEFRYFPGLPTRPEVEGYLDLIQAVKNAARETPVEELVNSMETAGQLQRLFMDKLPGTIRDRLLSMGTPDQRWDAFTQVATLCDQEEKFVRQDQLIRLTPVFVNYLVKSKQLTPLAAQYLKKRINKVGVMTLRDFRTVLNEARMEVMDQSDDSPDRGPEVPDWGDTYPQVGETHTVSYDYAQMVSREAQRTAARRVSENPPRPVRSPTYRIPAEWGMTDESMDAAQSLYRQLNASTIPSTGGRR